MTLSSLSPEDTIEAPAPSENKTQEKQDPAPPIPKTDDPVGREEDKAEKMPVLGELFSYETYECI